MMDLVGAFSNSDRPAVRRLTAGLLLVLISMLACQGLTPQFLIAATASPTPTLTLTPSPSPTTTSTPTSTSTLTPTSVPSLTSSPTLVQTQFVCNGSGITNPSSDPNILFQDDFSSSTSGWDQVRDAAGITDYDQGGYRILVLQSNFDYWANPSLCFGDVSVEVKATKIGGPDDNDFGILCRYQDVSNFYLLIASSDGYWGIAKVVDGDQELIGMSSMEQTSAIDLGNPTQLLRADCVGSTLTLYINGQLVGSVQDTTFAFGDVGLIAGTFDIAGTDMLFDDFTVRQP